MSQYLVRDRTTGEVFRVDESADQLTRVDTGEPVDAASVQYSWMRGPDGKAGEPTAQEWADLAARLGLEKPPQ